MSGSPTCVLMNSSRHQRASIGFYTICLILRAFRLVAIYDLLEDRCINDVTFNLFTSLLYKANRFHVDVCLFSNISQKTSKCGKATSDTRLTACVSLSCSYHILTSSVIYYWTEARQHGIYSLNGVRWWSRQIAWLKLRDFDGYVIMKMANSLNSSPDYPGRFWRNSWQILNNWICRLLCFRSSS